MKVAYFSQKKLFLFLFFFQILFLDSCSSYLDSQNIYDNFSNPSIKLSFIKNLFTSQFSFEKTDPISHLYPLELLAQNKGNNIPEIIEYLLQKGVSLASISFDGKTALNYAASNIGYYGYRIVNDLLNQIKDINFFVLKTSSPLVDVAANTSLLAPNMMYSLINAGFSVNRLNTFGKQTPLMLACRNDGSHAFELVNILLQNKSVINNTDIHGNTIFHFLALNTGPDTTKIISLFNNIKYDTTMNKKNKEGLNPLYNSIKNTSINAYMLFTFFLKHLDAQLLDQKETNQLFLLASQNIGPSALQITDFLLLKGADINYRDSKGYNAILYAAKNPGENAYKIISDLIEDGVNLYMTADDGMDVLRGAAINTGKDGLSILLLLEKQGLSLLDKDIHNRTLLHYASSNEGNYAFKIVDYLLSQGLSAKTKDNNGDTPLILATQNTGKKGMDVVRHLIYQQYQGFADQTSEKNPILSAVLNTGKNGFGIVRLLVQLGFDSNSKNSAGQNALILGCQNEGLKTLSIIKYLVLKGLNINQQDLHGNTPLYYAFYNTHYALPLIHILLKNGADPNIRNGRKENLLSLINMLPEEEKSQFKKVVSENYKEKKKSHY